MDWIEKSYGHKSLDIKSALANNPTYQNVMSPSNIESHRYISEDIAAGLVPLYYFGKLANVNTTSLEILINLANQYLNRDFYKEGRDLSKMGLQYKSVKDLLRDPIFFDVLP
jgi:opine dehydrogenase